MAQIIINETLLFKNIPNHNYDCVSSYDCVNTFENYQMSINYDFVWFFIIGFIFTQIPYFFMNWKINNQLKMGLLSGFKIAGYLLNMAGVLYFLVFVVGV